MKADTLLAAAALTIVFALPVAGITEDRNVAQPVTSKGGRLPFLHGLFTARIPNQPELASLERATEWLNSPPLAPSALRGKVVLIDFWTYTCINWLPHAALCPRLGREVPRSGAGGDRRPLAGIRVRARLDNVRWAVQDMRIDYPVAVDSDHVIWRAFRNQYWPALYFVDAQGRIRHHYFGEGAYEQSEMIIQAIAGRGRSQRRSARTGVGGWPGRRSGRGLERPQVPGELSRLRRAPRIRLARRSDSRRASRLCAAAAPAPEPMGARRAIGR